MPSAFSTNNPRLQVAWDASSLKSLQFCGRYYQLNNLEGWQTESVHLSFGRLVASGMELYQKLRLDGFSREDALIRVAKWALEETYYEGKELPETDDDDEGYCIDCPLPRAPDTQWGGRYESMWKCTGVNKYKNEKGNRAKCPFAFEKVWFPGDPPDVCGSCGSPVHAERLYIPDDKRKNRHTLLRALIWYGLDQPEDIADGYRPYVFPDGTPAVELSGRLPLPKWTGTGEQYMLTYNFDYIGQFGEELFITDNKTTTKTLNQEYFDTYSPDTQFDTYDLIGSVAFPALDIKGTMVDAISLTISGVEFGKHAYYKTEEQREEHFHDLEVWLGIAEQYALAGYWPMNKRNCWLCPFKRVCSLPPKLREGYLKSNFEKGKVWDPLAQR